MNRRPLPVLRLAALSALAAAALGCADLREPLIIGESYTEAPSPLPWLSPTGDAPTGKGGGPSDNCHEGDVDLGDPEEVPEGYGEGDDSEFSPAHPQHLRDKKKRGFEEKI